MWGSWSYMRHITAHSESIVNPKFYLQTLLIPYVSVIVYGVNRAHIEKIVWRPNATYTQATYFYKLWYVSPAVYSHWLEGWGRMTLFVRRWENGPKLYLSMQCSSQSYHSKWKHNCLTSFSYRWGQQSPQSSFLRRTPNTALVISFLKMSVKMYCPLKMTIHWQNSHGQEWNFSEQIMRIRVVEIIYLKIWT